MPTHCTIALALILVVSFVACADQPPGVQASASPAQSAAPASSQAAPADGPLVTIETRGGECPEGACGGIVAIDADGRVHTLEPAPGDLGTVPGPIIEALATEIAQTDFSAIKGRPFTGECPIAYDGQETIYTFRTAAGPERIASCEFVVDSDQPIFAAVSAALAAAS